MEDDDADHSKSWTVLDDQSVQWMRLPTGCLSVLTTQRDDPNVTYWRENELAESKSGCYAVHQEI